MRGATFPNWDGGERWGGVITRAREVYGWVRTMPELRPLSVGPHVIDPRPVEAADAYAAEVASIPWNLARKLGIRESPDEPIDIPWRDGEPNRLARVLTELSTPPDPRHSYAVRRSAAATAFQTARTALIVPDGHEDELSVLLRWLRGFDRPAVRVSIPLPLDWMTARRAVLGGSEDAWLRAGIEEDPWLNAGS